LIPIKSVKAVYSPTKVVNPVGKIINSVVLIWFVNPLVTNPNNMNVRWVSVLPILNKTEQGQKSRFKDGSAETPFLNRAG
jgi:hypothetical protein